MNTIKQYLYTHRFALAFLVVAVAVMLIDPSGQLAHGLPFVGFGVTEALKSTTITNRDATPAVINDGRLERAAIRRAIGSVTTTSAKTVGSTYTLASVPSTAMIDRILIQAAAMTQGAFDIGVYRNTKDGGAVVDADYFATAVDCSSAVTPTDITNESGTNTITKQEQPLWQAIGMTSDPGGTLDIVATSTNTITAGALLGIKVYYADNGN